VPLGWIAPHRSAANPFVLFARTTVEPSGEMEGAYLRRLDSLSNDRMGSQGIPWVGFPVFIL
jgi:hypothetical protein